MTRTIITEREIADMRERISEIVRRRLEAYSAGSGKGLSTKDHLALIPEATTVDDIYTLHEAREMLDPFSRAVLDLYADVWREWGKYRCSVCGRTSAQSAAIGYDCGREC